MQISEAAGGIPAAGVEPCRFPKLEECAHFHYERVQLPQLMVTLQTNLDQSLHSQHSYDDCADWHMVQVTSTDECWLVQRSYENFKMLDAQLHQCIYDRKISQLPDLSNHPSYGEDIETLLIEYLARLSEIINNSLNCGPALNWLQMDNKGHRLLVPSEESRSINTPAVAAAYSVRRYVSQARDELNLEVGDMISVIDMASPAESVWWRGKRGFQVGFFPQHCVHIIGDKVPRNMPLPPPVIGSLALTPVKPVLRKHGKLIAFFRSFILNRPSRRRLKQSGILKERVFGCDLGEHLLNSGHDIPTVLKCCTEFIEKHGIVDGIYRLSGVTSNIQKLRNAFDEDRIPDLYTEDILQDIHSVASLLKMYFRELPNPLCTYQLYQSFVSAVQGCNSINRNSLSDRDRLLKMREAVQKLPPPHYRTLEYIMRHLSRVAQHGSSTGMTTRNIAIVWAPNLLRCAELEVGGVAALQGVGVQAVVTEFLICYADLIFCDHLPSLNQANFDISLSLSPKRNRPKSLAISTPAKLITLEEARTKHLLSKPDESGYIEVGGGPKNLPKIYHTVIELPPGSRKRSMSKRSPSVWRSFFSKSRTNSHSQGSLNKNRKASTPGNIDGDDTVTEESLTEMKRKLRPVKSAESLTSGHSEPASTEDILGPLHTLCKPPGHNRSISHDSYFDTLQSSQHNSEGSLYDLSEIQINFELEESEMHIFSEDESLVSSPRVHKDAVFRRVLTRARPEDISSTNNSNNPSPKKQARVVLSPDLTSRKRTRLEDQLSDIQYIDCNTPDNTCIITTTTAVIHSQPEAFPIELYQPKNKSPRNYEIGTKRQSLDLEKTEKITISKSYTENNIQGKLIIPSNQSSAFASPQSPVYKQLEDSSANTTPDFAYQTFIDKTSGDENEKTVTIKNIISPISKKSSPTYENVLTTISITYKSPCKSPKSSIDDSDCIYEDVLNIEQAVIPTSTASLPLQEASQPDYQEHSLMSLPDNLTTLTLSDFTDQRPKSLSALEDVNEETSPKEKCSSLTLITTPYMLMHSTERQSLTDLSLSEVIHSSTDNLNTSQSSISFPLSPSKHSSSPNVSPMIFYEGSKTLSEDILRSLSPSVASILEAKSHSGSSLLLDNNKASPSVESSEEMEDLACLRHVNPEYLKLTDNNINSNEEDASPIRIFQSNPESRSVVTVNNEIPILKSHLVVENVSSKENTFSSKINVQLRERPIDLNVDCIRPKSINLIEFSPSDPVGGGLSRVTVNDKRKSCETEVVDDDHTVYQQVKYFRRSVNEINALLDLQNPDGSATTVKEIEPTAVESHLDKNTAVLETEEINYDSLEGNNVHIYENVDRETPPTGITATKSSQLPEKLNVRSLLSHFEVKETLHKPPIFKRNDEKNKFISSKSVPNDESCVKTTCATNDFGSSTSLENVKVQRLMYERGSLPPCLRARNMKNAIKTRSLDEDAFIKEFGVSRSMERRNSVDENFGSKYHNLPKILNQPKPIPIEIQKIDIHLTHSTDSISINLPELNRERIEKYKEERRKFLHDKYRSESFKEDKDVLLSRFKQKVVKSKVQNDDELKTARISSSDPGPCSDLLNLGTNKQIKNETEVDECKDSLECDIEKQVVSDSNSDFKESIRYKTALFESHSNQNKQTADCDNKAAKIIDGNKYNPKKVQEYKSPVNVRKNISVIENDSDILGDLLGENDFIRNRRRDEDSLKNERRRHTFETRERDRETEADRVRRISLEGRSLRKDTKSPSYCIKDMKAIFESKSHQ